MPRAFVIVLDACGVGALPDAATYGDDPASNTLEHVAELAGGLDLPVLGALGLGCIEPCAAWRRPRQPALHGRLAPLGPGKESVTGHWELMGVVPRRRFRPTRTASRTNSCTSSSTPLASGSAATGRTAALQVLEDFGEHHLRTRELILYTSADSVLQIAAHHDVLDEPALHARARSRVR